ncbi:MAG TPA: glyoxalase superfamily protein, partial [Gaiellaceae bacterium]|nr:glyoxalase superfamily protein [Gaiellaceae bacterium]
VEDAGRAVAWYERLGFEKEWEHQFEPGFPWFVSVARGDVRLYLSEHEGDARPNTLIHLYVKDVDAVSQEFGVPVDEEGLAGRECDLCGRRRASQRPALPSGSDLALRHIGDDSATTHPHLGCVETTSLHRAPRVLLAMWQCKI